MGGHGNAPHPRGFSLPPPFGELSRGREDGCLGRLPTQGEKFPNQHSFPLSLTPFLSLPPRIWSMGPPPRNGQGPVGLGRRERRLKDVTQVSVPSAPCFPATAALQIGAEPASPQRSPPNLLSPRLILDGRGEVGALPKPTQGRVEDAKKTHLGEICLPARSGCCVVLCKYLKTLASRLYNKLRKCKHVSKINTMN